MNSTEPTTQEGMHRIVLILDDDLTMTEGLAAGLERRGRTLITCNDDLPRFVQEKVRAANVPLNSSVLEITEQGSLGEGHRNAGVRLALDDVGIVYSHLGSIEKIRPKFLKVSQHFGAGFEMDKTKLKIVRNILSLADDFGCELILQGVETKSTAIAAREMGIKYGQGYYFSAPVDASALMPQA